MTHWPIASYEITATGLDEFQCLLRQHWWDCRPPADPFLSAFAFLPALPRSEAVEAETVVRGLDAGASAGVGARTVADNQR